MRSMEESGKNLQNRCQFMNKYISLVRIIDELPEDECLLKPILYQDSHSWKTKKAQICNSNSKCQITAFFKLNICLFMDPELCIYAS